MCIPDSCLADTATPVSAVALRSFFFNDTATTEIYTLSLHDLFRSHVRRAEVKLRPVAREKRRVPPALFLRQHIRFRLDRKSTRLNSSHTVISYAVFCLKKKIDYSTMA